MRSRRMVAGLIVVLAVLGLAGPAAPASANAGLPVPVQPLPGLPSTTVRGITNAGAIGNANANWYAWMLAQIRSGAGRPGPGGVVVAPSVPVTGPKPIPGVAVGAGSAALSGWFAIAGAGAGIKFVGQITGNDFDSAMCGADQWLQTAYGWMTMGMGPGCVATVLEPNGDVTVGLVHPTTGAVNVLGRLVYSGSNIEVECYGPPGIEPSGYDLRGRTTAGGAWGFVNAYTSTPTNQCKSKFPGATQSLTWPDSFVELGLSLPGSPSVVEKFTRAGADPMRDSKCTLTWPDGSTTEGFVGQYRESEGFPIGVVDAACTEAFVSKPGHGPGLLPSDIKVGSTNTDSGAQTEIVTTEMPEWTEDESKGLDPGDGTGLKLWKIRDKVTYSCMTWAIDCSNWWTQTDSGTQTETETGTYRCTWGGNKVALNECGPYRETFNDPDLDSRVITDPGGFPQPYPIPGPGPNPTPAPGPGPAPGTDPAGECFSDGWSSVANPLDWVLVPVKCALVWAFVPSATKLDEFGQRLDTKWRASTPGQLAGTIAAVSLAFESIRDGSCGGLVLPMPNVGLDGKVVTKDYSFMAACAGSELAPIAAVVFWLSAIGVSIIGLFAIKMQLDRLVNNT